jgi:hypothetical protein
MALPSCFPRLRGRKLYRDFPPADSKRRDVNRRLLPRARGSNASVRGINGRSLYHPEYITLPYDTVPFARRW